MNNRLRTLILHPSSFILILVIAILPIVGLAQGFDDLVAESGIPVYVPEIVSTLPHSTTSWTQGLACDNGFLYESVGEYGKSKLLKLNASTGSVDTTVTLPDYYFGEGLAICRDEIVQLSWLEGTALIYDKKTLARTRTLNYDTEGWGLATYGETILMSDGSSIIRFRNPQDFTAEWEITANLAGRNIRYLNELEYVKAEDALYANILNLDYIVRIKPSMGDITAVVDCSSLREQVPGTTASAPLNGIAYDSASGDFFLTGKLWPKIFRVKLIPKP